MNYEEAAEYLAAFWAAKRPYPMSDLSLIAMCKFELEHRKRIPSHLQRQLDRLGRNWEARDRAHAHATRTEDAREAAPDPVETLEEQDPTLAAEQAAIQAEYEATRTKSRRGGNHE